MRAHLSFEAGTLTKAFTLIELLVCVVIVAILAAMGHGAWGVMKERSLWVQDIAQMKNIGIAATSRAQDNNGHFYFKAEIGNSSYRAYTDKYSLCQILKAYLEKPEIWVSPKSHPDIARFGNSYAWSRSPNVTEKPISLNSSLGNTILLWNNHSMLNPSPNGRPDPGASGGPKNADSALQKKPWKGGKAQNWLYADGRVATF